MTETELTAAVETDLTTVLAEFTGTLSRGQPYRHPTAAEAADGLLGVRRLIRGADTAAVLEPLGFSVTTGLDLDHQRPFALARSETGPDGTRAWGIVLVDRSRPVSLVVGCPHPGSDETTEQLGLELWREVPGTLLLIAGAHRDAGTGGSADPRDNPETMFHQLATGLMAKGGLPHLQLHGFADDRSPGTDVVLSAGPTTPDDRFRRASRGLAEEGLAVVEYWLNPISNLGATTNIQGLAADAQGTSFVHVEVSRRTRFTPGLRSAVLAGLARTDAFRLP